MCDPILVTLLKMRPHYGQSSRKNATPSSGTSPLASYKAVPPPGFVDEQLVTTPPPPPGSVGFHWENFGLFDKWLLMGGGHLRVVIVHGGWTV